MIPGSVTPLLLKSATAGGALQIERSSRFNSADSAYLNRTYGSPTTQNTFTWAGWVKLGALSTTRHLFGVSTNHSLGFTTGDALNLTFGGTSALTTTAVFRDPSAWYHIVWTQSGTSQTLYVNNVSVGTATATSSVFNTAVAHQIGAANTANYFNGYLANIHFIDGQALDPTSFTETDATTGQLIPKTYSGSYGTNGFNLLFADNSSNTASTLGKDTSGLSNNWTPNNLSVTAGAGNDSLVDSPTNYGTDTGVGGEVRGNYATLNPLFKGANVTLSNGNLDVSQSAQGCAVSTIGMSSGKWYAEYLFVSGYAGVGICTGALNTAVFLGTEQYSWSYATVGYVYHGSGSGTAYGAAYSAGDIIGVAFDATNGTLTFYKNGTTQGTAFTGLTSGPYFFAAANDGGQSTWNFGQRAFAYTAPSGFKALCTQNLPAPLVTKSNTVMDVVTYTGTGAALTPTSSLGFNPDWIWIKSRSAATDHALYDVVRGAQARLESNTTDAEVTTDGGVTAFNSAGFTLGTLAQVNTSAATYVAWCWDAGGSTVSNTQGSITSQVRANPTAGFSVVTFTAPSSGSATIGHGLGVEPYMVIIKSRDQSYNWCVYHKNLTSNAYFLNLNTTAAESNASNVWNNTTPTSTVFSLGGGYAGAGATVAYVFSPVVGYSSFGSYTGNGSTDGPFVYTGFRPRWILIKSATETAGLMIYDTARDTYNQSTTLLYSNLSLQEQSSSNYAYDILSNGFKVRNSGQNNTSSATYIYAAFAEAPFNYSRAR